MRDGEWNKERGARPSCVHDCMAPSLTTHSLPHAFTQLFEVTCVVGPDLWVTRRGLGDFEVLMSEVRPVCPIAPILSFSIARVALTTSTST